MLAGLQGREAEAVAVIDATIRDATAGGQGTAVQYAHWARAMLLNGLGRYQEALAAAQEASDDTPELFVSVWALSELIEAATRSEDMARARSASSVSRRPPGRRNGLGPGDRGPFARAAERRRDRRAPVSRGDRAAGPHAAAPRARAGSSALRRVAAPREPASRRARAAAHRPRAVRRRSGWRRSPSARARSCWRPARGSASGRAETRDELTAAGAPDRPAGPRRALEPGDRGAALPQPAHRGVAPAQGVRQARDPLAPRAGQRTARLRLRAGPGLSSGLAGRLDDPLPETPLEVAVGVEPERLEPRELLLLAQAGRTARRSRPGRAGTRCRRAASPGRRRTWCARSPRGRSARAVRRSHRPRRRAGRRRSRD